MLETYNMHDYVGLDEAVDAILKEHNFEFGKYDAIRNGIKITTTCGEEVFFLLDFEANKISTNISVA